MNFYLPGIQMSDIQMAVRYSDHNLSTGPLKTIQLPHFLSAFQVTIQLMDHSTIGLLLTIRLLDMFDNQMPTKIEKHGGLQQNSSESSHRRPGFFDGATNQTFQNDL